MSTTASPLPRSAFDEAELLAIIDVPGTTRALDAAKDLLDEAIRRELIRAGKRTEGAYIAINTTEGMMDPLLALLARGRHEAEQEMTRMGLGAFADGDVVNPLEVEQTIGRTMAVRLRSLLLGIAIRAERDLDDAAAAEGLTIADAIGVVPAIVEQTLARTPYVRDTASQMVSSAYARGLGLTYEDADAEGLFAGYQATSVLDANTCGPCAGIDGTVFPNLAESEQAGFGNGGFGPYSDCQGGFRCRCRTVPVPR